jgi:Uncharacterised protein family (UPF0236)
MERGDHPDFESLEQCIRSSMHSVGSVMLEGLLNADGGGYQGTRISRDNEREYEFMGYQDKGVLTLLGEVQIKRAYYYDAVGKEGCCPKDKALAIEGTSFSPGVRRMTSRVGGYRPFELGHEDVKEMAGIDVTAKEVERISHKMGKEAEEFMSGEANAALSDKIIPIKAVPKLYIGIDGTGIPMVKAELINTPGKAEDGKAKTREVKLGCVFTQTTVDKEGRPVRDEESTSYVGAIETAEEFAKRIYGEAKRRGLDRAQKVIILGDGAVWIWNIADECFPWAIQIVDLYHACEYYWKVARAVLGSNPKKMKQWAEKRRKQLTAGNVNGVIAAIQKLSPSTEHEKDICDKAIGYFQNNKERMKYDEFRRQGLFVGSGVIEAGCRTVIGQRLKQSGMHWTVEGANSIIALRCCFLSNRWEDLWEARSCA